MNKRNMLKMLLAAVLICASSVMAAEQAAVKGNPKSRIYHLPACKHFHAKGCTAEFKSEADAVKAGYTPCKQCAGKKDEKPADKKEEKKEAKTGQQK